MGFVQIGPSLRATPLEHFMSIRTRAHKYREEKRKGAQRGNVQPCWNRLLYPSCVRSHVTGSETSTHECCLLPFSFNSISLTPPCAYFSPLHLPKPCLKRFISFSTHAHLHAHKQEEKETYRRNIPWSKLFSSSPFPNLWVPTCAPPPPLPIP